MTKKRKEDNKTKIFKIVVYIAAIYHLILGAAAIVLPAKSISTVSGLILGYAPSATTEFALMAKFTGVYVLVFGALLYLLAKDPVKYVHFAYVAVGLFTIRFINRLVVFNSMTVDYGVPFQRNVFGLIALGVFAGVIYYYMPKNK